MLQDSELARAIHACTLCPLAQSRTGIAVPSMPGELYEAGGVALLADVVVSEADKSSGRPYAGGRQEVRLLESMLEEAGLSIKEVLVMFRVRCGLPQGKVADYPEALYNCNTWTIKELEAYNPGFVVLFGTTCAEAVFGKDLKITSARGKPRMTGPKFEWGQRAWVPTAALYAATLRKAQERQVVADLRLVKELMSR